MSNRNRITKNAFAAGFLMALNAFGQFGPPPVQSSPALQLPVSGRAGQSGNMVVTHQATTQGEGPSVLQPSLDVNGSFAGSVPGPDLPQGEVRLSLSEAVTRGLRVNLGSITADSSQRTARAQRAQALSQLLPQISANLGATETQIDLAALGLTAIGGSFKGVPERGWAVSLRAGRGSGQLERIQSDADSKLPIEQRAGTCGRLSICAMRAIL